MMHDPFLHGDENVAFDSSDMGSSPPSTGPGAYRRPASRPPLGEVQRNLSSAAFGASPTMLKSPVETTTPPGAAVRSSMGLSGEWQKLHKLVTWEDRQKSAIYFAAGNVVFLSIAILPLDGVLPCTPLTMAAYCLIGNLFLNFVRFTVKGPASKTAPLNPQAVQFLAERLGKILNYGAARHNELFEGSDPRLTLDVALSLWAVATLGAWFSFYTLSALSFEAAFLLPWVYREKTKEIDGALSAARKEWEWRWSSLGLSRGQKVSASVFFVLAAMWFVSTTTVLFGLFCGLLLLRLHMQPHEFDHGVDTVRKTSRRITMGASDLGRSMLSPFSVAKPPKGNLKPHGQ